MNYNKLPKEIWSQIFTNVINNIYIFLNKNNIINICLTCKMFNNIINSKEFENNNNFIIKTKEKYNKKISDAFKIIINKIIYNSSLTIFKLIIKTHEKHINFKEDMIDVCSFVSKSLRFDIIKYLNENYNYDIIYNNYYKNICDKTILPLELYNFINNECLTYHQIEIILEYLQE